MGGFPCLPRCPLRLRRRFRHIVAIFFGTRLMCTGDPLRCSLGMGFQSSRISTLGRDEGAKITLQDSEDDVPKVCVGVLPQLFPRSESLAQGPGVRLLHHLAEGVVPQGGEGTCHWPPRCTMLQEKWSYDFHWFSFPHDLFVVVTPTLSIRAFSLLLLRLLSFYPLQGNTYAIMENLYVAQIYLSPLFRDEMVELLSTQLEREVSLSITDNVHQPKDVNIMIQILGSRF